MISFTNALRYAAQGMRTRLGAFSSPDAQRHAIELLEGQAVQFAALATLASKDDSRVVTPLTLLAAAFRIRVEEVFGKERAAEYLKLGDDDGHPHHIMWVCSMLIHPDSVLRRVIPDQLKMAAAGQAIEAGAAFTKQLGQVALELGGQMIATDEGMRIVPPSAAELPPPDPDPEDDD